jgi:hypothetical protein
MNHIPYGLQLHRHPADPVEEDPVEEDPVEEDLFGLPVFLQIEHLVKIPMSMTDQMV